MHSPKYYSPISANDQFAKIFSRQNFPLYSSTPKQCILCGSKDKRMTQYGNWGSKEQKFLLLHLDSPPTDSSSICKSHFIEAQRHHNDPYFMPKWKSKSPRPVRKCSNPKCNEPLQAKLIKPAFVISNELEKLLGVSPSVDKPIVLCQHCYNTLYRQFHTPNPCASCGATPKGNKTFCLHSPNASAVSKHITIYSWNSHAPLRQ